MVERSAISRWGRVVVKCSANTRLRNGHWLGWAALALAGVIGGHLHRLKLTAIVTVTASGINLVKEPIRNAGLMPDYRSGIVTGVGAESAPPGSVVSCSRGPYVV